jgi:hypothetical protein
MYDLQGSQLLHKEIEGGCGEEVGIKKVLQNLQKTYGPQRGETVIAIYSSSGSAKKPEPLARVLN